MTKKTQRGLGRGLGALLGEAAEEDQVSQQADSREERVTRIPIEQIDPNREQPRKRFDEAALNELAQSIQAVGVLQPIIVARQGDRYQIIAGERRYRASRLAGLHEIPAIVRDWDEQTRLEAALIENLQRDDLNPVEEAMGVKSLMEQAGLTQDKAAQRLGKSRPAVANLLRLLTLPASVLELISEGKLSAGHARALVTVDPKRQTQLANLAVQQGWSVRQLERICAQPFKEEPSKPSKRLEGQLGELEGMVRDLFGTRVKLDGNESGGKISLYYYSADDLQRIWDVLEMARNGQG
ncbi:MAG: ParB/RepB/Spo0J family partition protein [Eubacteriales bacterium]|nr:ParB/RepB/Spo0J family partition protein [Eubacteriales bacterium]